MPNDLKTGALAAFTNGFKTMPPWGKVFIMLLFTLLIAWVVTITYTLKPITDAYVQVNQIILEKESIQKTKEQREATSLEIIKQKQTTDSILAVNNALNSSIALRNREDIEMYVNRLQTRYASVANVSFWSMHNGGKVMDVNSPLYLEVLKSSDFNVEDNWSIPERIPSGYLWYALELEKNKIVYIPAVKDEPRMYTGPAKTGMQTNGTRSIMGAFVKNVGSDWYFVSISFSVENPTDKNPSLYRDITQFRNYVKRRI